MFNVTANASQLLNMSFQRGFQTGFEVMFINKE